MVNLPADWGEAEYKDVEAMQNMAGEREYLSRNGLEDEVTMKKVLQSLRMTARDNGRTPMQVSCHSS